MYYNDVTLFHRYNFTNWCYRNKHVHEVSHLIANILGKHFYTATLNIVIISELFGYAIE